MKFITVFSLLLVLLSACGEDNASSTRTMQDFRNNGYDFAFNFDQKYHGIRYKIPEAFQKANKNQNYGLYYGNGTTIRSNGRSDMALDFNIYYSIERFKESDKAMSFVNGLVVTKDLLNLFQDGYVISRITSIEDGVASLKKKTKTKKGIEGVIQTVRGYTIDPKFEGFYYTIATLKVKDEYYVFQWMCDKEMMDYTYDDFETMLRTVRPIK